MRMMVAATGRRFEAHNIEEAVEVMIRLASREISEEEFVYWVVNRTGPAP